MQFFKYGKNMILGQEQRFASVGNQGVIKSRLSHINISALYCKATKRPKTYDFIKLIWNSLPGYSIKGDCGFRGGVSDFSPSGL